MSVDWPTVVSVDLAVRGCPSGVPNGPRSKTFTEVFRQYGDADPKRGVVAVWILDLLMTQIGPEAASRFVDVQCFSVRFMKAIDGDAPPPTVAIISGRYVSVFAYPDVYDAELAEWVGVTPTRWFETRVFNVRELVAACLERAKAQ